MFKKSRMFPTKELYAEVMIPDIRQMYVQELVTFFHNKKLVEANSKHNTRLKAKVNVNIPRCFSFHGQRHSRYLGPRVYNLVPTDIIHSKKYLSKKKIRQWIFNTDCNQLINFHHSM